MSSPAKRLLCINQDEPNYRSMESQSSESQSSDHADATTSVNNVDPTSAREEFLVVEDQNLIPRILEECEKKFLKPYRTMLQILGWAPNSKGSCVRVILVMFWFLIIVTTSITQILSCFRRDMFIPGETGERNGTIKVIKCENHLISTFILLDVLIITSYTFGIYLFSKGETEYLFTLAEKVFLKNSQTDGNLGDKNRRLTRTIFAFFLLGIIWIILSTIVRVLTALSVQLFTDQTIIMLRSQHIIQGAAKLGLIIFSLIGFIFFDVVYVSAVLNYVAQSEMNIYLMSAIKSHVIDNEYHSNMKAAMKDIVECCECLRVLNGKTATATALILFNIGSAALVSLITLNDISEQTLSREALATAAAGFNVILWIALISFPFIQAARVTHAADKLKETGPKIPHLRLYDNTPPLDLDFYLHLTQAIKLRATMFGIPVHPWMVYAVLVTFTFTMLVLFQLGVYNFTFYL